MPDRSRRPSPDVRQTGAKAAQAARLAASRRGVGQFARLGYFAIGMVYAAMGVLAMLGLLGVGAGQYTGSFGAVRALIAQSYGRVILFVLVACVGVYVTWRLAQSVFDVEGRGSGTGGLLQRGGLFLSAYSAGFLDQMDASGKARRSVASLGRFGFFARGVVFGVMAFFLIISAMQATPGQARGLGGALQTLGRQPYGRFLIGVVAVGLFSYGLFMLAKARFRHLAPGTPEPAERIDNEAKA